MCVLLSFANSKFEKACVECACAFAFVRDMMCACVNMMMQSTISRAAFLCFFLGLLFGLSLSVVWPRWSLEQKQREEKRNLSSLSVSSHSHPHEKKQKKTQKDVKKSRRERKKREEKRREREENALEKPRANKKKPYAHDDR